ncbi:hypothetical protein PHET_01813 [Paragonimus heterotremus]|uniref:Transmembrane protein n=1 Tax=Paragonimus heterotremus TaxID=100268 RepID=A0A8J4SRS2_9TREM|nr:hypothetical protein PHET_01813 [Paragonimus heterotremus]
MTTCANQRESSEQSSIGAMFVYLRLQVLMIFLVFSPFTSPFPHKINDMSRIIVLLCTMWLLATLTVNIDCRILREPHLLNAKNFHGANDWEDRYAELPMKKRFHVANVWDEPDEY